MTDHYGQPGWQKSSRSGGGNCVEVADFRKSSRCGINGDCVEVADFRKSSRSYASSDCVEVAPCGCPHRPRVFVRDSKNPEGGVLAFDPDVWAAFVDGVKAGEFD